MGYVIDLVLIAFGAALINNFVLYHFVGICPLIGVSRKVEMATVMKDLMKDPELKIEAKRVSSFVTKLIPEVNATPEDQKQLKLEVGKLAEKALTEEAKIFLKAEFKAEVTVYGEEDPQSYDPKRRASAAKPYRPAIYIE